MLGLANMTCELLERIGRYLDCTDQIRMGRAITNQNGALYLRQISRLLAQQHCPISELCTKLAVCLEAAIRDLAVEYLRLDGEV
eukprot:SAG31_NODE_69_length_28130_cov_15.318219_8_plen_84_part_00